MEDGGWFFSEIPSHITHYYLSFIHVVAASAIVAVTILE
jgi:hypothetical protein